MKKRVVRKFSENVHLPFVRTTTFLHFFQCCRLVIPVRKVGIYYYYLRFGGFCSWWWCGGEVKRRCVSSARPNHLFAFINGKYDIMVAGRGEVVVRVIIIILNFSSLFLVVSQLFFQTCFFKQLYLKHKTRHPHNNERIFAGNNNNNSNNNNDTYSFVGECWQLWNNMQWSSWASFLY